LGSVAKLEKTNPVYYGGDFSMGKIRVTYDVEFKKKAIDLYLKDLVTGEVGSQTPIRRINSPFPNRT